MTPILPKHLADRGDAIVDAILDAIEHQAPDIKDKLFAAIKVGRYEIRHEPTRVAAYFPVEDVLIEVALVATPLARRPTLDA